jgi:hypothetical protein
MRDLDLLRAEAIRLDKLNELVNAEIFSIFIIVRKRVEISSS